MCNLCAIQEISSQGRWPKPLEEPVKDITFLVSTSHDEYESNKTACQKKTTIPESLLDTLRLLAAALEELDSDREKWWSSDDKRAMRKRLDAECTSESQRKLTDLHKINNATNEKIESMKAKLGVFCKWSLGMNGGVWELVEGAKVKVKVEK